MKIIRPTTITDTLLTSSTVSEDPAAAWASGTTYAVDAIVSRAATHRRYRSLVGANLNHAPESSPTQWQDIGPTNRWAMFDQVVGSATSATASFAVQLLPGGIDALAVVDCDAETVRVQMINGGTTVYDQTKSTQIGGFAITDWYLYFFEPIGFVTALTFFDLPTYPDATVTVTFTSADPLDTVSCGTLIVGRQMALGLTEAGAKADLIDFSRKSADDFGHVEVVERAFAKRMTVRTMVPTGQHDAVYRTLAQYRARPILWVGEEGYDCLTVYGFFKELSLDLAYSNISYCSLTIEGLT